MEKVTETMQTPDGKSTKIAQVDAARMSVATGWLYFIWDNEKQDYKHPPVFVPFTRSN